VVQKIWEALAEGDTTVGIDKGVEKPHILSHGRSGVQGKHYDRYFHLAEKR
jgi:hypothetical protein